MLQAVSAPKHGPTIGRSAADPATRKVSVNINRKLLRVSIGKPIIPVDQSPGINQESEQVA